LAEPDWLLNGFNLNWNRSENLKRLSGPSGVAQSFFLLSMLPLEINFLVRLNNDKSVALKLHLN
jgi:hypothetical protein